MTRSILRIVFSQFKLLLLVSLVILQSVALNAPGFAQSNECSVEVQLGNEIQSVIDAASQNDVICLAAGEFEENLSIQNSMTIRGAGIDSQGEFLTKVVAREPGIQVISIFNGEERQSVVIEGLAVEGATKFDSNEFCANEDQTLCPDGITIIGEIDAHLIKVRISDNADDGLVLFGSNVLLENVEILDNEGTGVFMHGFSNFGASQLTLNGVETSGSGSDGLIIIGPGQLSVIDSLFSRNGDDGIAVIGSFDQIVTLSDSEIRENQGDGIFIQNDSDRLLIQGNIISSSGACGIRALSSSIVAGMDNVMLGNEGADLCGNLDPGLRLPLTAETTNDSLAFPGSFSSLQEAIDAIAPGGVISLDAGEFDGSAFIWKPVSIQGAGIGESIMRGMLMMGSDAGNVNLSGLSVAESPLDGVLLHGNVSVVMRDVEVIAHNTHGITLWESAQLDASDLVVVGNGAGAGCDQSCHGLFLNDESSLMISDSVLDRNNGWGLAARTIKCGYGDDEYSGSVEMLNVNAAENAAGDFCFP
jgi:hypothetical protein